MTMETIQRLNGKTDDLLAVQNVSAGDRIQGLAVENHKPKLDERFLTSIQGKDFVVYAGLLDLAHQSGLMKLEVESLQAPSKENGNIAICRAVATSRNGQTFSDLGDANPENVNKKIVPHIIRMASTRAKARALRDMCNVGIVCLEELGDWDEVIGNGNGDSKRFNGRNKSQSQPQKPVENSSRTQKEFDRKPETNTPPPPSGNGSNSKPTSQSQPDQSTPTQTPSTANNQTTPRISEAQKKAVLNLSKRRGISDEELNQMVMNSFKATLDNLTATDAASFIRTLQQSA